MFDAQALFSDNQAVTTTAASTNFLNLGEAATVPGAPASLKRDIGAGKMPLRIQVDTTFAGLTSLEALVEVDDNSSFSSAKVVGSSGAIVLARLLAGTYLPFTDLNIGTDERYIRIRYVVVGTATAGAVTAGVVTGVPAHG